MLWQILEKVVGYCFILSIIYIISNTVVTISDQSRILTIKEELRVELKKENERLKERVIRVEVKQDEYSINQRERVESLEQTIRKYHDPNYGN